MPGTIANTATFINNIDALLAASRWDTTSLSFSFTDSIADYGIGYPNRATHAAGFQALNATQQAVTRSWLLTANSGFYSVSLLSPYELTGASDATATIRLAMSNDPATAYAYFPSSSESGGDVWLNQIYYNNPVIGTYAYHTFGHELGHALGLNHGHEAGLRGVTMDADRDSMEFSIMTYRSYVNDPLVGGYSNESGGYAQSLMMYDIAAIQKMYGAWFGANSGNTRYTFSTTTGEMFVDGVGQGVPFSNRVFRTIWDGDGVDTYDFSNYSTNLSIDLAPGGWSNLDTSGGHFQQAYLGDGNYARGHVFNALQYQGDSRSLIENAVGGSGHDVISGNAINNVLSGGAGNDTMDGGAGDDTLYLGDGDDYVNIFSGGNDVFWCGTGNDFAWGFTGSETYYGEDGNDTLRGSSGNDTLFGGAGNDILDGGSGIDQMNGGDGDDIYVVDDSSDFVGESFNDLLGGANDSVQSSVTYSLLPAVSPGDQGYGIENLTLTGALAINGDGNGNNNQLIGNAADNLINGHSGADTIRGGSGRDTLWGASASQTNDIADQIYGELGNDLVGASYGNDLVDGGDGDDVLYGDEGNDQILGGSGNDSLYGDWGWGSDVIGADTLNGGAGNDLLRGGAGNDSIHGGIGTDSATYDNAASGVTVSLSVATAQVTGGAGTDTLVSIENLTGSSFADRLTGNNVANQLYGMGGGDSLVGNAGNDSLFGGDGADSIYGGDGNDWLRGEFGVDLIFGGNGNDNILSDGDDGRYYGEAGNDLMISGLGGETMNGGLGIDTIDHTAWGGNYTFNLETGLTNYANELYVGFENVIMGAGDDLITGSALANVIIAGDGIDSVDGGAGADRVYGGQGSDVLDGGLGSDIIIGGGGADRFRFSSVLGATNLDTIIDFSLVEGDSFQLLGSRFSGLGFAGVLAVDSFALGEAASDAAQRILYDSATGLVSYDSDGNGIAAKVNFAQLNPGLGIDNTAFVIV
jgi:serralysin